MAMRLRHIEVVNAIRVTGTTSAAAELLNLTQPGVSQILQSAELQLGYALFTRSKGRLIPTREAVALFPEIERLEQQLDAVRQLANNLKKPRDDTLHILAAPALALTIVPSAVLAFNKKFPGVRIAVRSDYSAAATTSLALQEADVGILYHSLSHPAIEEQMIGMSELVLIGQPTRLPQQPTIGLDELGDFSLIGPDAADPIGKLLTQALTSQNIELDLRITAQSYHSVVALVERLDRVGIVDAATAIAARERGLRVIEIRPSIKIPIVASTASGGEESVISRYFISACRAVISNGSGLHAVGSEPI